MMQFDPRDILIILNIIAMIGAAFYLVGMLRTQISHLAEALKDLRGWLELVAKKLDLISEKVAVLQSQERARHD